jgi:hypothetical protein
MARPWWQRLLRKPAPLQPPAADRPLFEFDDRGAPGATSWRSAGWWLRAESKPVRAGIVAAAKAVPALLTAWTFNTPEMEPVEVPLPRGDERLALLCEWGLEFGGAC